jgi:site-specific DNA-adenine methylase
MKSTSQFEIMKKKQPSFLKKLSQRLHSVLIESSDPIQLIKSTDSEQTLFFINPNPIHLGILSKQSLPLTNFIRAEEFIQLLDCIAKIKGRFILLHPKSAALMAYCKKFNRHQKPFSSTHSSSKDKTCKNELFIVRNYTL